MRCLLVALIWAASFLGTTEAAADATATPVKPWKSVRTMKFFRADTPDFSSVVYRQGPLFLAAPSAGDIAYLVHVKEKLVYAVDSTELALEDGLPTLEVADLSHFTAVGQFEKAGRGKWLVWEDDGNAMSIRPKPPLIGVVTAAEVLEEKPAYREKALNHVPAPGSVDFLGLAGVEVVVGFGTWCPVCAEWTPRFLRVLEEVGEGNMPATFVSVDPDLTEPADALAQYNIESVPTFAVWRDGVELGRVGLDALEGNPDEPLESRLVQIIKGAGPPKEAAAEATPANDSSDQ